MTIVGNSKPRLVEVTSLPVIYVDDIGKVDVEGSNVRITYIEIRKIGNERVAMPVLEIVRPMASYKAGAVMEMIRQVTGASAAKVSH